MFSLLSTQRFLPLFVTQFLGAFNDNLLKNALVIMITYDLASASYDPQFLVTIAAGAFILPFFLFSTIAGQLADKYDRAKIARIVKLFEILIMLVASIGFYLKNPWFLIAILFASGTHSTFFGPIKYALLPQHLYPNELLSGNAYIEAGTFLAILLGTICGGVLIISQFGTLLVSICLLLIAVIGYVASLFIPKSPAPSPLLAINYSILRESINLTKYSRKNKYVILSIMCISWFWFIGALFLAQIPTFVKSSLHTEARVVTLFLTIFSVGIGVGSFLCSKLMRGAIKLTYVSLAALGLSLFTIDLYVCSTDIIFFNTHGLYSIQSFMSFGISWRIIADLLLIAICGGIYIVPLYTALQHYSDKNYLARMIATNNIFNALFMVIAVIFTLVMLHIGRTIPEVFLTMAIINIFVAIYLKYTIKTKY